VQSQLTRLVDFLDSPLFLILRISGNAPELRLALGARHLAELDRIKHTVSWCITAPLRVVWNFGLRLVGRHPAAKRNSKC